MILQRVRDISLYKHIYTTLVAWDRQVCKTVLTAVSQSICVPNIFRLCNLNKTAITKIKIKKKKNL